MSTILQAQQKSKREQAGGPAPIVQQQNKISPWKVMLSLALATIITLLSILIYLQLTPRLEVMPIVVSSNESQQQQQQQSNSLQKVTFETQPLAILAPEPKKVVTAPQTTTAPADEKQHVISHAKNKHKETLSTSVIDDQEADNIQTSEALKRRFDLAVLMSDIEANEQQKNAITDDNQEGDGSDIHKMSGNFQDKVPLIRYDSHMYSSIKEDRWIRINGEVLKEGEVDSTGELELLEIQPQRSIFRLDRQSFSLESLVDWRGY